MDKAKVYFTDFRTKIDVPVTKKLQKLIRKAGIGTIDMDGKFVAIKMHFGELGNLAYLRPNYARAVADVVKEQGGMPFLTDCNTLYPGSRKHALEHLDCANINGFNPVTTGCQILIADGLRGTDDLEVPVPNGEYCKTAYIGRAVMDADIFISLTHFKGHELTGFGGTIKNIGMGCGSRAGKMQQHNEGHPHSFAHRLQPRQDSSITCAGSGTSRGSTPLSARAAAAASARVRSTLLKTTMPARTPFSDARWPNIRRRSARTVPASTSR